MKFATKKGLGILSLFFFSQIAAAEIREVMPLDDFSQSVLEGKNPPLEKVKTISKKVEQQGKEEAQKAENFISKMKDKVSEGIQKAKEGIQSFSSPEAQVESILSKDHSSFVDISEKEMRGKTIYRNGEDTPFTGVFALFMGDWIQYIETYQNGMLDGESSWYTQDGTRVLLERYSQGKLHGKQYSYYENGRPKAELDYDKGKVIGVICFDPSGQVLHKSIFENGTGLWKLYWENGNVLETGKYTNYKKDGIWKRYNEDGSLESTLEYDNGRLLKETWG